MDMIRDYASRKVALLLMCHCVTQCVDVINVGYWLVIFKWYKSEW